LDNNNIHIDKLIKDKIEQLSPSPPDHIWTGIEKGIHVQKTNQFFRRRWFIAASILILFALITSIFLFNPISFETSDDETLQITNKEESSSSKVGGLGGSSDSTVGKDNNIGISDAVDTEVEKHLNADEQPSDANIPNSYVEIKPKIIPKNKSIEVSEQDLQYETNNSQEIIEMKKDDLLFPSIYSNEYKPEDHNISPPLPDEPVIEQKNNLSFPRWKTSYYITPELSISHFDSVEILNSYSINIEPTYFLNKNWFFRFGAGLSFVRDRGFARISYITNEYMGSYEDVYDITFDTILGNINPVFHTKSVEIWDSIPHISVSGVTNRYFYLQVPALFGYQYKKPGSVISWYFMGGPAFNLKVASWIDNPKPEDENSDIVDLQNNLPIRSDIYFQLWLGAGIEYEINKKISIAIEPGYRYNFKSIYNNPYNHTSSSGFTLRVGLVYLMK
jgi:hypothetical protein|tara:strand:- start:1178 stop:2518 length:1341 start_codon:yes stop_codon:yes gene_type:complete